MNKHATAQITERLSPPRDGELQVAFATDGGYANRVEVAAFSVLRHATCPVRIILICTNDAETAFPRLDAALHYFPEARIERVYPAFLNATADGHSHTRLPPAAFGRMLLPHLTGGRVLYLDGDVMVRRDLSDARDLDLKGNLAAAVHDTVVKRLLLRIERTAQDANKRQLDLLARAKRRLSPFRETGADLSDYFNSGVMIFDCDAIREEGALMQDCLDFERARQFITFDQDLINILFSNRILELDASWNAWVDVVTTLLPPFNAEERAAFREARRNPRIVHYYGKHKPWDQLNYRHLRRGLRWHLRYLACERALNRLIA